MRAASRRLWLSLRCSLDDSLVGFLFTEGFRMSKKNGVQGKIILPGERETDRMTVSETAEQQFIEKYNGGYGMPILLIKEAVRKWNAGEDSTNLGESTLFEEFRKIQAKIIGEL